MKEKLVTIVVLPYSKAQILKMRLEEQEIECELEDINLMEDAAASVKVKIIDKDIWNAIPVLEEFLGKKPELQKKKDNKDEHILVPVDFSPVSFISCKLAFNIASHLNVKLVFMHCYINPVIHSVPYADVYVYDSTLLTRMDDSEKNANKRFRNFIQKLSNDVGKEKWTSVETEYIIKPGYADEDILAYAHENNSRLIVMGTGGDSEIIVGSVTADVIYNAKVPVLVIPEKMPQMQVHDFNKVLYATNFDEKDFVALDKLIGIMKPFDVKVYCIHVGKEDDSEWNQARLEGMRDILTKKYAEKDFDCRLLIGKNLLEEIDRFIEEENIDIISLTTHKRNMISQIFNPSVAKKMVFHARTPLLIFHA
jgi:nucleotide-binding universal stress UspA family protein